MTTRQQNQRLSERSKANRPFASSTAYPFVSWKAIRETRTLCCSVRGPRAYLPTNPPGRGWPKRHIWLLSTCRGLAAPSVEDALMSPRAMGDFIVRAADARVAFYDGTWILIAMIEQSCAPRVSSTVAGAFR
jgi:hypothetical protein